MLLGNSSGCWGAHHLCFSKQTMLFSPGWVLDQSGHSASKTPSSALRISLTWGVMLDQELCRIKGAHEDLGDHI